MIKKIGIRITGLIRKLVIKSKFIQDIGTLTISTVVNTLIGIAQGFLVIRILGPEQYGVSALVISFPSLIYGLVNAKVGNVTLKYLTAYYQQQEEEKALALLKLGYLIGFVTAVVTLIIVWATSAWAEINIVHQSGTKNLMIVFSLGFLLQGLEGSSIAVLNLIRKFNVIAIVRMAAAFFRAVVVLSLLFADLGVTAIILGYVISTMLGGALLLVFANRQVRRIWKRSWFSASLYHLKEDIKEILKFIFYDDLTDLMAVLFKRMDRLLLGYFRTPVEVGYYNFARSIAQYLSAHIGPVRNVTYQRIVAARSQTGQSKGFISKLFFFFALPMGLANLLVLFIISPVVLFVAGAEYEPALFAIRLFIIGNSFWFAFYWVKLVLFADGRVKQWFILNTISSVTFVISSLIIFTSGGDYNFIAISSVLSVQVFPHLAGYILVRKNISTDLGNKPGILLREVIIKAEKETKNES